MELACGCVMEIVCGFCCNFGFCVDPERHEAVGVWHLELLSCCPVPGVCTAEEEIRRWDAQKTLTFLEATRSGDYGDEVEVMNELWEGLNAGIRAQRRRQPV